MSGALLLEPHADDCTLFAAFTAIREKPHVVTVFRSASQEWLGVTAAEREAENAAAMEILGCEWEQWHYSDAEPAWEWVEVGLREYDRVKRPERVYAPFPEPDGNPQHNRVGELAAEVFGDRVRWYLTYRQYPAGKQRHGRRVEFEPEWVWLKLRALACYRSQIMLASGPMRFFLDDLHEYEVPTSPRALRRVVPMAKALR